MPKKKEAAKLGSAKHPKFAPLTLDSTFKREFASEENKNLLLFLLNTFLEKVLKSPIKDVRMIPTVQIAGTRESRGAVFDALCEDSEGNRFIVEMQVNSHKHFIKRAFFYLCLAVADITKKGKQILNGKEIAYDFNYPIVYSLNFMSFDLNFGKGCDEVVQYISMHNRFHPEIYYDLAHMVFVRLPLFSKTERQCKTDIDMFLYSFRYAEELDEAPASFKKAEFRQLFEIAKISNFTKEERMRYDKDIILFSDHQSALEYAEEKGETRGMEKGVVIGEARGVLQTAKNMLMEGLDLALIMRITGLPKKQIMELR